MVAASALAFFFAAAPAPSTHVLQGPFESLDAFCRARVRDAAADRRVAACVFDGQPRVERAQGSLVEARVFVITERGGAAPSRRVAVGMRTDAGWFVDTDAAPIETAAPPAAVSVGSVTLSWSKGGLLVAQYATTAKLTSSSGVVAGNRTDTVRERTGLHLVVCGVDSAQKPTCTAPIAMSCPASGRASLLLSWSLKGSTLVIKSATADTSCEELGETLFVGPVPLPFR